MEKILSAIKENSHITIKKLQTITNLTRRGIEWNLSKLVNGRRIKRIGPDKGGHWEILD